MNKYKVVMYEHLRYEILVEAKDEDDARWKCDIGELDVSDRDPDYYESEIVDIVEVE